MKYRRIRGDGTIVIESKSKDKGFKMVFTDGVFDLNKEVAKLHDTTVEALKKKIEASDFFGVKFVAVK